MIKKLIFLFIFYLFLNTKLAMAEKKSLSNYLWENRLLIISLEKGNIEIKNFIEEFIQKNQCEFDDRNLKVIFLLVDTQENTYFNFLNRAFYDFIYFF